MNTKKIAMTFSIKFWAIALTALLIYQFSTEVSAGNCKFEKNIDKRKIQMYRKHMDQNRLCPSNALLRHYNYQQVS